jgi:uncharacterized membrane protein YdjX (TVP38/TMEM64 family)
LKQFLEKYLKFFIFVVAVALVLFSPVRKFLHIEQLTAWIENIKNNPFAPFMYILIYVIGVIFALPGTALTIIAAPLFGFWQGLVLVIVGSNIGCQLTFWISRSLGGGFIQRFVKSDSFMEKASKKIEENGFMFMLYIRLMPIIPFNGINYLSGLTKIRYKDYALATLIGMLPWTAVYVHLSYTAADIRQNPLGIVISIGVLVLYTLGITLLKKNQNKISGGDSVDR